MIEPGPKLDALVECTSCKEKRLPKEICDTRGKKKNCIFCRRKWDRKRYYKNKEKRLLEQKEWLKTPKGRITRNNFIREYYYKNREKFLARAKLKYAVKIGKIKKPKVCSKCYNKNVQGHHVDYKKPLLVLWLCQKCHFKIHRKMALKAVGVDV